MQKALHVVFPDALINQAAAARGIGIACRHTAHKLSDLVKNIVYQFTYLHRNPKKNHARVKNSEVAEIETLAF